MGNCSNLLNPPRYATVSRSKYNRPVILVLLIGGEAHDIEFGRPGDQVDLPTHRPCNTCMLYFDLLTVAYRGRLRGLEPFPIGRAS